MEMTSLEDLRNTLRPILHNRSHWVFVWDEDSGHKATGKVINALIAKHGEDLTGLHYGYVDMGSLTTRERTTAGIIAVPKWALSEEEIRDLIPKACGWDDDKQDKFVLLLNTKETNLIETILLNIYEDAPLYTNDQENLN